CRDACAGLGRSLTLPRASPRARVVAHVLAHACGRWAWSPGRGATPAGRGPRVRPHALVRVPSRRLAVVRLDCPDPALPVDRAPGLTLGAVRWGLVGRAGLLAARGSMGAADRPRCVAGLGGDGGGALAGVAGLPGPGAA